MAKLKPAADQTTLPGMILDPQTKLPLDAKAAAESKNGSSIAADRNEPSNLNRPVKVAVPNFADPKRPKTCLEVDFPIVPINALSQLEGNAGKPIYQMSKWWARRRSSVFRAMLIAAATQAPIRKAKDGSPILDADGVPLPDEEEAARTVWDLYYANHQKAGNFNHLTVLDCFMGGGTTLVEGSRLGFQITGVDLNPVAWFVVKNAMACTDPEEVRRFFDEIEAEVKPVVQPFYVTECPRGHVGKWFRVANTGDLTDDQPMPNGFDPLSLEPKDRKGYRYRGPESIYTFWAKHGPCSRPECGHRTPVFRSPVIAEKELGVKFIALTCKKCKCEYHAELGAARMAPGTERVILDNEPPFTELSQPFAQRLKQYNEGRKDEKKQRAGELFDMLDNEMGLRCPKCQTFAGEFLRDVLNHHRQAATAKAIDKKHLKIQPPRNSTKSVFSYLLIDPEWLKGSRGIIDDQLLGGYSEATVDATNRWYESRLASLRLIEVRGRIKLTEDTSDVAPNDAVAPTDDALQAEEAVEIDEVEGGEDRKTYGLPKYITLADGRRIDTRKGTVPQQSHFTCGRCGQKQDIRESVEGTGHGAPISAYAVQCYCPECDAEDQIYGGRFFAQFRDSDNRRIAAAEREWTARRDTELSDFWPHEELPHSYMTHHANFALPKQGYTHWWKMFHSRQLLVHALILKEIHGFSKSGKQEVAEAALIAFQQHLRYASGFSFYQAEYDKTIPHFSNNNYSPKSLVSEISPFAAKGAGRWSSCAELVIEGLDWVRSPWEVAHPDYRSAGSDARLVMRDAVLPNTDLHCCSSSELPFYNEATIDLIITDPPFGDNIFYSDLANFFHVWLRLPLRLTYPDLFEPTKTPNAQEALAPRLLAEQEANDYYKVRLTACWVEACRVLKDGGLLAFTFHHSEDLQWAIVLESLFDAGFILEQTFPIASDEQKGEGGQFGAKGTEYDIIHVCRKRLTEPEPVSWAKMRQWVKAELLRLKSLLAAYKADELSDADIRVILRGKALEFYSRHYGQVFTSAEEALTIRHALANINQLLDEGTGEAVSRPPSVIHAVAYEYLRLFTSTHSRTTDDVNKSLFSTTIHKREFEERGWVQERNRRVTATPIRDRFEHSRKRPRKEMKNEIDQAHFLIGGALPNSGVHLEQELSKDTWMVRRSVDAVLEWYAKSAIEPEIRQAAELARTILRQTLENLRQQPMELDRQLKFFNDWDESA